MRRIVKRPEPDAWVEFRSRPGASYDDADAPKPQLRDALVREQHGLCCYCLGRIHARAERMKIEHWASQHRHPDRQLEYANLLGACLGGQGGPPSAQHCDTAKGDRDIATNPADPRRDCAPQFVYGLNGDIRAADGHPAVARDIETLMLDHPRLKAGRRERVAAVLQIVMRTKGMSAAKLEHLASRLEQPDERGQLEPFCQAAIFWLRRQANKRA